MTLKKDFLLSGIILTFFLATLFHWGISTHKSLLFPNSDFEYGDLTNWRIQGTAFISQPIKGDTTGRRGMGTSNHTGQYWVGTYEIGYTSPNLKNTQYDEKMGVMQSIPFTIEKPTICFLVGGGDKSKEMSVSLMVNGKIVRSYFPDARLIYTETMHREQWNVEDLLGQQAYLIVKDFSPGGWGHINVDDFSYGLGN